MKIIYLHQYFNTPEMSGGTRSYEMARRFVQKGHSVHMLTSRRDYNSHSPGWEVTNEAGIVVHWYSVPYSNHMGFFARVKAFLAFAYAARKRLNDIDGDIIFATSTPLTIALPAVPAAKKNKIPMVFEVRDLWPEMPIAMGALRNPLLRYAARWLERWAYKNSAAVIALSPGMKEGVVATGYPANRVAVIPNSSDNNEFSYNATDAQFFRSQRNWLGDKPLLVYTGTFGKVNGVDYMVDLAIALLKRGSDIQILLVGDGSELERIKQLSEQAGVLGKNLYIENPLPKKDIPALLSAATLASALFIDLPEMRPNSANKFFDSLASGTPVLLNYGGWMHDLVTSNECGLLMWKKSVEYVAEQLDEKMHDEAWLKDAGCSARKLAEEFFDRDVLATQLISVLQSAVDGNPDRAVEIAPGNYSGEVI
jgi:glycosyltransferase involved in cell wall biosynthesis